VATQTLEVKMSDIVVRQLGESDLSAADQIFRLAFGTFLGLPDPATSWADVNYVHTRWRADPTALWVPKLAESLSAPISPPTGAAWDSSDL
jgi:hypothetical protein